MAQPKDSRGGNINLRPHASGNSNQPRVRSFFKKGTIEKTSLSINSIGELYGVDGKQLSQQYKLHLSNFTSWDQLSHASEYVVFPENISHSVSMDEVCLSQGELYTIVTSKSAKGKKGALVAIVKGTKSDFVIEKLKLISTTKLLSVKEITIDLSPTMNLIAESVFPSAEIVSDRFHVQKLMNEAVSDLRVSYRWESIEKENKMIETAKKLGHKYIAPTFKNGDTRRQLLARSRHIVLKHFSKWTPSQKERAEILFREYPFLKKAYDTSMGLVQIYNTTRITKDGRINKKNIRGVALLKLTQWYNRVELLNSKYFNSVIRTMQNNYASVCNYFVNRATNAAAESFNAKVKVFRSQLRGVRDIPFFIFRLTKLFA